VTHELSCRHGARVVDVSEPRFGPGFGRSSVSAAVGQRVIMVNFQQGLFGLGVLTLLFGGDIYSMFAGQSSGVRVASANHFNVRRHATSGI